MNHGRIAGNRPPFTIGTSFQFFKSIILTFSTGMSSSASVDCIMEELQMTIVRMKCASSKSAEIIKAVGTNNSVIIKAHIRTGEGKGMTWMHLRWNQVGDW